MRKRTREFPLLLFTHTVGHLGDILYISLMVIYLKRTTGSTLIAALFPFVRVLAMFGSSFVSPFLLEKLPLVRLLTLTRAGETALMLGLAAAIGLGAEALWVPFAFVLLVSFLQGWADPVVYSLVPRFAPADRLARANATLGTAREVGVIAAWGVGATLAALFDPVWLLAGCALLFAAGFAASLRLPTVEAPTPDPAAGSRWASIRAGWQELLRNPVARAVAAMDLVEGIGISIFAGAFTLTFVEQRLGQEEPFWGFLNAAYFVGMIAGGAIVSRLGDRLTRRTLPVALALGSLGYGIGTLAYGATTSPLAALLIVAGLGLPCMARETAQRTLLQLNVPERKLPNVLVAHGAMNALVFAVSLLLMGAMADAFGIASIYYIGGGAAIAGAALGLMLFARRRPAAKVAGDAPSEGV
ncbi:MFS transporter [Paenibacillus sp.]|uniref:MFS transporter n=1 Tax=Paenibacillus sp. TaxID=58172 RepID=UPI002811A500|nr:MFS transporter [Paenibacillus sp.]